MYLKQAFPDDSIGSRIIITSRLLDVASYIDPSYHPHHMNLMDEDKSWNLLSQMVFAQETCPHELEQIGMFIAEKCGGLPLAIVVIAGILLKANRTKETWEHIAMNVNEAMNAGDENFIEILSLSYKHLPHHLRPCFLYMGGFPEYYEVSVSKLVKLWVAEGFIKSDKLKIMEQVAEEYLEDLTKRSLVLVVKKRHNGNIKTVMIHDLLRNVCSKIAQDEKFIQVVNNDVLGTHIHDSRRVVLTNISGQLASQHNYGSPVCSIIIFIPYKVESLKSFTLLVILDLEYIGTYHDFPFEIGKLFHLRYLAFKMDGQILHKIPQSLSKLRNLQTLFMQHPGDSNTKYYAHLHPALVFGIWQFPQLRHFIWFNFLLPDPCSEALTSLENLHTLSGVSGFTCTERILNLVPNLNQLKIVYSIQDISGTGWSKYRLNNLVLMHSLEKLNLQVNWRLDVPFLRKADISFPVTLKKLTLCSCQLPWQDITIIGSLPNLEVLKFRWNACYGYTWETNEGEFRRLRVLLIEGSDPKQWVTESSHFPCLQRLHFYHCKRLKEIPDCIGDIAPLELIELGRCNDSLKKSAKRIKDQQRNLGNDDLLVYLS